MTMEIRGRSDEYLTAVMEVLKPYGTEHSQAQIVGYRQNSVAIRVRIVDPDFTGISREQRHEIIWELLETLPEEIQNHLSTILLLTPDEAKMSFANVEFDDPIPSKL